MISLLRRAEQIARAGELRLIRELADRWRAEPGVARVSEQAGGVLIEGRALVGQWLRSPALRFFGRAGR